MQEDASTPTHERLRLFKQSSHNILMSYNYSKQSSHDICYISQTTQKETIKNNTFFFFFKILLSQTRTERNNGALI
jgi:hypothetical protein